MDSLKGEPMVANCATSRLNPDNPLPHAMFRGALEMIFLSQCCSQAEVTVPVKSDSMRLVRQWGI